jgi:DNA-binding transcriptional regulator YiaG
VSPTEFRSLQTIAQLKNRDVQSLFEVSDQTVINWRYGYTRVPGAAAALLRRMAADNTTGNNHEADIGHTMAR